MKSYYIHQENKQPGPDESITLKTEVSVKKWKTFLAVLALIGAAYLIIKLQQPEPGKPAFQTINTPAKTPVKIKEEHQKREPVNPGNYLQVKIKWRKNLFGAIVLEGTVHNTAAAANFKDPVLSVTWLSKTNSEMETDRYPLYEYLGAGNTIQYKLKVKAPSKIGDVKVSVESATAVQ